MSERTRAHPAGLPGRGEGKVELHTPLGCPSSLHLLSGQSNGVIPLCRIEVDHKRRSMLRHTRAKALVHTRSLGTVETPDFVGEWETFSEPKWGSSLLHGPTANWLLGGSDDN